MPDAPSLTLATAASERKERLLALKKRKAGEVEGGQSDDVARKTKIALRQRNFDPITRQPASRTASAVVGQDHDGEEGVDEERTVERRMAGIAEKIVQEDEAKRTQELDLLNIQPKRANWDLKRDMDKRMRKMDRKTQEAYEYLFRQRLQAMRKGNAPAQSLPGGADLLANMSAVDGQRRVGAEQDAARSDEDDEME